MEAKIQFTLKALLVFMFLYCLKFSWDNVATSLNHNIREQHSFRQSQTAISIASVMEGGPLFAAEIPVLGSPWSLPFEFPFYQWLAAATAKLLEVSPEHGGRLVSIFFFYLCLLPLYLLARRWKFSRDGAWILLSVFLIAPLHLYWPRTVMIETTALFFSLLFVYLTDLYLERKNHWVFACATLIGILAALVKITTFFAFNVLAGVLVLNYWYKKKWDLSLKTFKTLALIAIFLAGVPIAATLGWNLWTDQLKALNPLANGFLTSDSLNAWMYGTIAQKTSADFFNTVFTREITLVVGSFGAGVAAFIILDLFARNLLKPFLLALLLFSLPILVFSNVHWVHDYYGMANSTFLVAATALAIYGVWSRKKIYYRLLALAILGLLFNHSTETFSRSYKHFTVNNHGYPLPLHKAVEEATDPNDVLMIWGLDWSPELPYMLKRRAIMDRWNMRVDDPRLQQSLAELKKEGRRVGALLFCLHSSVTSEEFVAPRVEFFKAIPEPIVENYCKVFKVPKEHEKTVL